MKHDLFAMSHQEVGAALGLEAKHVDKIEKRAFKKLRRSGKLKRLLEMSREKQRFAGELAMPDWNL